MVEEAYFCVCHTNRQCWAVEHIGSARESVSYENYQALFWEQNARSRCRL